MTRTKPKGHKRGAEGDSSDSRRNKRRAAEHVPEAASATPAATLSAEELFKLKNAGEFDDVEQAKDNHVEIKDEPTGDSIHQLPSAAGPSIAAIQHAPSPSVQAPARNLLGDQSTQVVNREDLLDNLLSQDFDAKMTRYAVQQILHVEARIKRLQQKGIASSRLSEVVQLFQTGLRDHVDRLSSRIEAIGGVLKSPTVLPDDTTRHALGQDKYLRLRSESSVKRPERGTIAREITQKQVVNNPRTPLAAFEASYLQSDSSDSNSDACDDIDLESDRRKSKQYNSKYLTDDDEDYRDDLDGDRSELTEEERSMGFACPWYLLYSCLLTDSTRSEYHQAKGQSAALWLSQAQSCVRHIRPLRDLCMHGRAGRCEHCHGDP